MKIIKVHNPNTLNIFLPWNFPFRHIFALFGYLLNTYDHSFLKVFINSQLILKIFQSSYFSFVPFPNAPDITPKPFNFFTIWYIIWLYFTSIEFHVLLLLIKVKDSILSELFNSLLISSYCHSFVNILCFSSSVIVFNLFYSLSIFNLVHSMFIFSLVPVLP